MGSHAFHVDNTYCRGADADLAYTSWSKYDPYREFNYRKKYRCDSRACGP